MRGETKLGLAKDYALRISIHSPHARGDLYLVPWLRSKLTFQSTPLMRGETNLFLGQTKRLEFQSTPLMRGETRVSGARPNP